MVPTTPHKPVPSSAAWNSDNDDPICHVIRRTLPLHTRNSEPGHCLDIIDQMYNIYYELEVKLRSSYNHVIDLPVSSLINYHLLQDEFSPKPYLSRQKDVNHKMRSILVDWLIEVHHKFKLQPQTLWLSVNILDRYLEKMQILRSKLQLVGVSALLIASKHEEIYPPEVKDCVYITDHAYDRDEVVTMESSILVALDYKVSIPTAYHFLCRYLNCIQASERIRHLASYYAERNLQESDVLSVIPHKFAAASVYAALKQQSGDCTNTVWTNILKEESGCTEQNVKPIACNIICHVGEEPQTASRRRLVATKNKYSSKSFSEVSTLALPII